MVFLSNSDSNYIVNVKMFFIHLNLFLSNYNYIIKNVFQYHVIKSPTHKKITIYNFLYFIKCKILFLYYKILISKFSLKERFQFSLSGYDVSTRRNILYFIIS